MEWSGWRTPASLIVLGHAALAIALFATDGHESLIGVLFVIAMIVAWVKALKGTMHGVTPDVDGAAVPAWYVALGSALLSLLVFIKPPGLYLQALNLLGMPLWQPAGPNGFSDSSDAWSSPEGVKSRLDLASFMGQRMPAPAEPLTTMKMVLGDTASEDTSQAIAHAESREQALALLFMAPEFQRR